MMKGIAGVSFNEFRELKRQCFLSLFVGAVVLFLAVGTFAFAGSLKENFAKNYAQYGATTFYVVPDDINAFLKANEIADYIAVHASGVTSGESIVFKNGDKEFCADSPERGFGGAAYYFKDYLHPDFKKENFSGGKGWTELDNVTENGYYNIFLGDIIAEAIGASSGDIITVEYFGDEAYGFSAAVRVKDIFVRDGDVMPCFVMPLNYCLELYNEYNSVYQAKEIVLNYFATFLNRADLFYKHKTLEAAGVHPIEFLGGFGFYQMFDGVQAAVILAALLINALAFIVISNIINVILLTRQKFIAKLKMIGASAAYISDVYFLILFAVITAAFGAAYLASFLFKGVFEEIGKVLFFENYVINIYWYVPVALYGFLLLLMSFGYIFFKKKIAKTAPVDLLRIK
ncbi:MAG: hypothetical protein LBT30_02370 [Clostridiales bacterium]|jgi:hypothetical protein|nr:hypothetical protein [Clostridiales bacterium]